MVGLKLKLKSAGGITTDDDGIHVKADEISALKSYGSMYLSTPVSTTFAVQGTFYKALGTTTAGSLHNVTMPDNNRLQYTGETTLLAQAIFSLNCANPASDYLSFRIAKNGTTIVDSELIMDFGATNESGCILAILSLETNDYIELFVANTTSLFDAIVNNMTATIVGL